LEAKTITFCQQIANEERVTEGRDLMGRLRGEQLSHGWCKMGDSNSTVGHPLGKSTRSTDIIGGWDVEFRAKEERSKHWQYKMKDSTPASQLLTVTLNWIMCDATEHREFRLFSEPESLAHPGKEMRKAIMSSGNAFWNPCAPASERECA